MAKSGVKITIRSPLQSGEEFWITKRLTRVGSADGCDILLQDSGAPGHAVSIERIEDRIVVHNRSNRPMALDSAALANGESRSWPHGSVLRIAPQLELSLDCLAVEAVAAMPMEEEKVDSERATASAAPGSLAGPLGTTSGSSNLLPLLFIAGCIGMIGFLIFLKASGGTNATIQSKLTWKELWQKLPSVKCEPPAERAALVARFQRLYRYEVLGDTSQFERVQGEIVRSLEQLSKMADENATPDSDKATDDSQKANLALLQEFVKKLKRGAS